MQYLHDDNGGSGRAFGLGWKAILFALIAIALSVVLSIAIVQLAEPFLV